MMFIVHLLTLLWLTLFTNAEVGDQLVLENSDSDLQPHRNLPEHVNSVELEEGHDQEWWDAEKTSWEAQRGIRVELSRSWFIPTEPHPSSTWPSQWYFDDNTGWLEAVDRPIPVVFPTTCSNATMTAMIAQLEDFDHTWIDKLGPEDSFPTQLKTIAPVPYSRDGSFTFNNAVTFLQRLQERDRSINVAILVNDPAGIVCNVAVWYNQEWTKHDFMFVIATVDTSIALPLVTMLAQTQEPLDMALYRLTGDVSRMVQIRQNYTAVAEQPARPAYSPPEFLGYPDSIQKDQYSLETPLHIKIIALLPLSDSAMQQLRKRLIAGNKSTAEVQIEIVNWEGPSPTRDELYELHQWRQENRDLVYGYGFYVDHIVQDHLAEPQLFSLSRTDHHARVLINDAFMMIASNADELLNFCDTPNLPSYSPHMADFNDELQQIHRDRFAKKCAENPRKYQTLDSWGVLSAADLSRCEILQSPARAYRYTSDGAPVWYLRNFTLEEQRKIRKVLSTSGLDKDFAPETIFRYMGFVFPGTDGGETTRTPDDLRDLFEKSDSFSPYFDPEYSEMRFDDFPRSFIMIDDRIFDPEPRVVIASNTDLWHNGGYAGWYVGTAHASDAYSDWMAFDQGEAGPTEHMSDAKVMWLSDMTQFAAYYETPEWYEERGMEWD